MQVDLPISKSIAQRQLMLLAKNGEDLTEVLADCRFAYWSDDVQLLARHLHTIQQAKQAHNLTIGTLHCGLNATALRFLTAYCAQLPDCHVTLDGDARMHERPVGQLVDALRQLGADIRYLQADGFPPVAIVGKTLEKKPVTILQPESTQFVSALLLMGIEVITDSHSPYISMTREVIQHASGTSGISGSSCLAALELDWSAAAFWLEREALGLGSYTFPGLQDHSLQGDRVAKELFAQIQDGTLTHWDFTNCPDLYPAAAVACHLLHLHPTFTGLESLRKKESDRLAAVAANLQRIEADPHAVVSSCSDHRIAMAFLAAGFRVDDTACIRKSYPAFLSQLLGCERLIALRQGATCHLPQDGLTTHVVSDRGHGKKWAIAQGVHQLQSRYIWFTDADITPCPVLPCRLPLTQDGTAPDLIILPLRMEGGHWWQTLEYDAIQALTILSARIGHPVMCSAANMIAKREAWLSCEAELHPELPSGDDMFLLEAMKRHGKTIIVDTQLIATCYGEPSLAAHLRQRMRWAGKAARYTDRDILLCGAFTLVSNLLVYVLPGWAIAKWMVDYGLIVWYEKRVLKAPLPLRRCLRMLWQSAILTLLYPLYAFICLVGGWWRKGQW